MIKELASDVVFRCHMQFQSSIRLELKHVIIEWRIGVFRSSGVLVTAIEWPIRCVSIDISLFR